MSGFLEALSGAPADRVLFVDSDRDVTAGEIRAAARRAAAKTCSCTTNRMTVSS